MDFEIKITEMGWVQETADEPEDCCLHGKVFVKIGDTIVDPGDIDRWTISATAYHLLQSLYKNHNNPGESYAGHMLPCCGHMMFINKAQDRLVIDGCPNGIDWTVTHEGGMVKLIYNEHTQGVLSLADYRAIVFAFADQVKGFYNRCQPKTMAPEDREGYQRFWDDWHKMRGGEWLP